MNEQSLQAYSDLIDRLVSCPNGQEEAIARLFQTNDVLKEDEATKEAFELQSPETANYAHFSCHGYFNFDNPLLSALLLGGCKISPIPPDPDSSRYLPESKNSAIDLHKCLTLEDIFRLDLRQCRIVSLSACETGITDFTSISDEYIGLPSAFLYAGASNVLSTLWSVTDLSAALLMIRFYEYFQSRVDGGVGKNNATVSLKLAQQWLRELTRDGFGVWIQSWKSLFNLEQKQVIIAKFVKQKHPFASPYYWAAFQSIGK